MFWWSRLYLGCYTWDSCGCGSVFGISATFGGVPEKSWVMQWKERRSSRLRTSKNNNLTNSKRRKLMRENHKSWGIRIHSRIWDASIPEIWKVMMVIGLLMSAADARTWEDIAVRRSNRDDWLKGLVCKYLISIQVNSNVIRTK